MGRWNDINMNRKDKTKFLSRLLEKDKLNRAGHYWAKEVTMDYLTDNLNKSKYPLTAEFYQNTNYEK